MSECTSLEWDANSGEGCACFEGEDVQEPIVLSVQFCCEPKTSLKDKF